MESNTPPPPSAAARQLMSRILRCPHIDTALAPSSNHRCRKVVGWQWPPINELPLDERRRAYEREHELPEPWSGDLERALILFVSSNPSGANPIRIDRRRGPTKAPRGCWEDAPLVDYYHRRFIDHIRYGHHHVVDGELGKSEPFWRAALGIARELLPDADAGRDYVLTELVRCKSQGEIGVDEALSQCTDEYLGRTLALANNVKVVVALGKKARNWFSANAEPSLASSELGCRENVRLTASPERAFTYLALGHPAGGEKKRPSSALGPTSPQLLAMRELLLEARAAAETSGGR